MLVPERFKNTITGKPFLILDEEVTLKLPSFIYQHSPPFHPPPPFLLSLSFQLLLLLLQLEATGGHRIWGFSSPSGLKALKEAGHIFGDGTFEYTSETMFAQLWVLLAKLSVPDVRLLHFFLLLHLILLLLIIILLLHLFLFQGCHCLCLVLFTRQAD